MTETDLESIQRTLDCQLPSWFCSFYLNYPAALRATKFRYEDDCGDEICESPADFELCDTAAAIIGLNKDAPEDYQYSLRFDNWPDHYLVIGSNGCGENFSVDLEGTTSAVYRASPASGFFDPKVDGYDTYFDPIAPTLEEFSASLIQDYKKRAN